MVRRCEICEVEVEPASSSARREPFARPRQTSPSRKQGCVPVCGRTLLSERMSLLKLASCSLVTRANILTGVDFLQSHLKDGSCKCVEARV